jgi:hypothetical protein
MMTQNLPAIGGDHLAMLIVLLETSFHLETMMTEVGHFKEEIMTKNLDGEAEVDFKREN